MLKKTITIREKEFEIAIEELKENFLVVQINGKEYFFQKHDDGMHAVDPNQLEQLMAQESQEAVVLKEGRQGALKAPLGGTIMKIWVEPKQEIKKGGKLLTVVAMKMENEIVATSDCKVKDILVKANQVVNKGDLLITFE